MTWATPKNWADQDLVTANDLNTQLRDNLNHLLHNIIGRKGYRPSSDYTTSNTSFVDVDATNLKVSGQIQGDTLLALVGPIVCIGNAGLAHVYLDLILDGTTRAAGSFGGSWGSFATNVGETAFVIGVWTGVSSGSHEVKLQFKAETANAVTIKASSYINMVLLEG